MLTSYVLGAAFAIPAQAQTQTQVPAPAQGHAPQSAASEPPSAAAQTGPITIDALMHAFAQRKSGEARFSEVKYLSNLRGPVESSGTLAFRAPDHFEQHTLKPREQSLVVDGDTVTMSRDGRERVVSLTQYPEIATVVDSVRGTLTGDRARLEQAYKLAAEGSASDWHLTLTPIDTSLTRAIHHIVVSGAQDANGQLQIRTIETIQTDGDRSVLTIETRPS
ncbi:outer membrane lipoprotein carrier protein LolA [Pararobbsia silviterrae]|uniref:outer membrane lipoprotein carrier protein LolA n=1 Tax=Pararobbsia silviterrae TaxID=1792498 RepID=UPI0013145F54|nr:outer membrane lipoprotein carrier protein LolA [Pararobbsia silviterrae]